MTATADQPDPAAGWVVEFEHLIRELREGTARKLMALAENVTAGPGVWAALAAARKAFEFERFLDQPAGAGDVAEGFGRDGAREAKGAAAALVANLYRGVDAALDAGHNDPADPVVRKADFKGRPLTAPAGLPPLSGPLLLGAVDALPAGHPFKAVAPFDESGTRVLALGHVNRPLFRMSDVRRLTGAVREHRARAEADRRREEEFAAEQRRREWEASPAGQKERIARLEAALAAKGA